MNEWIYKIQPLNVSSDFMVAQSDMAQITEDGWELFAVYNHPVMLLRKKNDGTAGESFEDKKKADKIKPAAPPPPVAPSSKIPNTTASTQTAVSFYHKGTSLLSQEKYRDAIEEYNRAIELDSNFTMAYIFRANSYFKLKEFELAVEDFNKALSLKPTDINCKINRGICRYESMDLKGAIEDFNAALLVDSQNTMVYEYRGLSFRKMKQYEKAIQDFTKLIDDFKDSHAYLLRGDTKVESKDLQGAVEDYSDLIKSDPKNAIAYFKRSKALSALGDDEEAKKDLKKYNEMFNKNMQSKSEVWGEGSQPAAKQPKKEGEEDKDDFEVVM